MGQQASQTAWRDALGLVVASRALVLGVAVFAATAFASDHRERERTFDDPELTHPFGPALDFVASPLARWDAVWYLQIADSGYGGGEARAAFFPLYPLLIRLFGLAGSSAEAMLIAAYAISIGAFLAALYLLHRLAALELGAEAARPAVALLAFFPAGVYFGAPYAESLFLLLTVGAFYAARTGYWDWAGICAGLATLTRNSGVLLVVALLSLYLYGPRQGGVPAAPRGRLWPRFRIRGDIAWLALGPAAFAAFCAYLWIDTGEPLAFADAQSGWLRDFAGPLGGAWEGLTAAFDGVRQLASGEREPVYFEQSGADPFEQAAINLLLFGFLAWALVAVVGVFRRLPLAYGIWAGLGIVLLTSYPVEPEPLQSFPRHASVLFPLFMWLGLWASERRIADLLVPASAVGLGLYAVGFATWQRLV